MRVLLSRGDSCFVEDSVDRWVSLFDGSRWLLVGVVAGCIDRSEIDGRGDAGILSTGEGNDP